MGGMLVRMQRTRGWGCGITTDLHFRGAGGETAALALEISSGKRQSEAGNGLTQLVLFGRSQQVSSRLLQT